MAERGVHSLGARDKEPALARFWSRLVHSKAVLVVRRAIGDFMDDDCPTQAAALAYYSLFSLPPLLVIAIGIAGSVADPVAIEARFHQELEALVGPASADQVLSMLRAAQRETTAAGLLPTLAAVVVLLLGATGAFTQLQSALNRAWNVKPNPERNELMRLVSRRLLSFAMILGVAFLMLVSLVVSTLLSAFGDAISRVASPVRPLAVRLLDAAIALGGVMIALTLIFRSVPDAVIGKREALIGGAASSVLFAIGKYAIGLYLGNSNVTTSYGAAGALVVLIVWVYYSSLIVLFGAELAQAWAELSGRRIEPARGAVRAKKPSAAKSGGAET